MPPASWDVLITPEVSSARTETKAGRDAEHLTPPLAANTAVCSESATSSTKCAESKSLQLSKDICRGRRISIDRVLTAGPFFPVRMSPRSLPEVQKWIPRGVPYHGN